VGQGDRYLVRMGMKRGDMVPSKIGEKIENGHRFHCKMEVPITELPILLPFQGDENDGILII
jgi:hypothetical protein